MVTITINDSTPGGRQWLVSSLEAFCRAAGMEVRSPSRVADASPGFKPYRKRAEVAPGFEGIDDQISRDRETG